MSIDHRAEAEKHASKAAHVSSPTKMHPIDPVATDFHLRMAQVHATLAAGETTSADVTSYRHAIHTYRYALIRHIAEGLALSETDEAHQHARGLAQYLDSVGLNVDDAVEHHLTEYCGRDVAEARKPPSVRQAERLAQPSPWDEPTTP